MGNLPTMQYLRSLTGGEKRQPEIHYVCFLGVPLGRSSMIFFTLYKADTACSHGILVLTENLVLARKKSHLKLHPLVIFLPVEDGARGTGHSQSMSVSSILADL